MRNKTHRCERCISQEVVRSQTTQTKIETRGNDVFYVGASYLEVDGLPHSHELVDHLHSDDELVATAAHTSRTHFTRRYTKQTLPCMKQKHKKDRVAIYREKKDDEA